MPKATRKKKATPARAKPEPAAAGSRLVIVESPAKARTIAPLLGRAYSVRASLGHVRDLPKSQLGVDASKGFLPQYLVPSEKKAVVDELRDAAKKAETVYLATDPDREGEAISWHLIEAAGISGVPIHRVVFHEITPEAIKEAFEHPREIDMDLVNAQQARRVLDRIVGYSLSPVLWRKVRRGLSAGRVQSVALRMLVEREREIENFVPLEYWSIDAELAKAGTNGSLGRTPTFKAALMNVAGKRGKIQVPNQAEADRLTAELRPAAYKTKDVSTKGSTRNPEPPFTTSTLQQEASRKLNFTAQRTMAVAQQLYEGLNIGEPNPVGIITYMRTDSVRLADSAIDQIREHIQRAYGGDFVPNAPRRFTTKSRGAQEAHEGIRPTSAMREPAQIRSRLTPEQFRLYDLIWKRAVASQMASATLETLTLDVEALNPESRNTYLLRATHTQVVFPGYQVLYQEGSDDSSAEDAPRTRLPELHAGEPLTLHELQPKQHFTQPPPRYTDATLVKALEANGIGRPSTYAAILSTIQQRDYARKDKRAYIPQEVGFVVNDLLTVYFPEVVDIGFTAKMEDELDDIAAGKREWVPVVKEFYDPFHADVERANIAIPKVKVEAEPTGEPCDKCGKPMVYRLGRFGRFMACSGFPDCRNAKPILTLIGVPCPKDAGEIVQKKTKRGRPFYGCANFPDCDFTSWERPIPEPCPVCGGLMAQAKGRMAKCTNGDYTGPIPGERVQQEAREEEQELATAGSR